MFFKQTGSLNLAHSFSVYVHRGQHSAVCLPGTSSPKHVGAWHAARTCGGQFIGVFAVMLKNAESDQLM